MKIGGIVCSVTALGIASAVAFAADVVTTRQADMKAIAAAAKSLAGMFKEPSTYSSAEFKWAAELIRDKAGQRLINHFSAEAASADSKAKPNIIEEREGFDRLANDLRAYAATLALAAEKNPSAMTESMRMKPGEPMGGGPIGTHVQAKPSLQRSRPSTPSI